MLLIFAPFTIRYLIAFAQTATPGDGVGEGIGLLVGIVVMQILQSLGNSHWIYQSMIVGGQTRSALISALFAKSFRLSNRARAGGGGGGGDDTSSSSPGWSNGRIMNLMSNDTQRIFKAFQVLHLL